eukprot:scaffold10570_cov176-Amphora_coffeaeformis.AAC.26
MAMMRVRLFLFLAPFLVWAWVLPQSFFLVEAFSTTAVPGVASRRSQSHCLVRQASDGSESSSDTQKRESGSGRSSSGVITTTIVQDLKAGEDGYSLLRQPLAATNWDPNAQPDFGPPQLLDESKSESNQVDDAWWQERQKTPTLEKEKMQKKKADTKQPKKSKPVEQDVEEDFNLLQRSLDTLDYPRLLKALQAECSTAPARSLVQRAQYDTVQSTANRKKQNKEPSLLADTAADAQARYRAVQEMDWILQGGHGKVNLQGLTFRNGRGFKQDVAGRPPPLGGHSFDWEDSLRTKLNQGLVLEGDDLMQIRLYLEAMQNILAWGKALQTFDELEFIELPALVQGIQVNETLQELLQAAFDKDQTEGFRLSGTTFPPVGRLRARVKDLRSSILDTLDGLLALPSMRSKLALESGGAVYSEVSGGRLVIPVEPKEASRIGIVHDTSRSGKTVYVEPTEIVGPTNELRQVEAELRAEEARVWRQLTQQIVVNQDILRRSIQAVGQLDLVTARLRLGQALEGTVPLVQEEGVVDLRNAKHPILLLRGISNVVGSDVQLGADGNQGLVLTGPNSGGKTIILKLLGLVALMARAGIPVPAASGTDDYKPRVDFFNPILSDIGDIQSVGGDLSTFSGHMLVCREVLNNAGRQALVLMDEVGSGTDPAQGVAIAQALLEALVDTGSRVAITTHYMQLKQLAAADKRFAVGGMQFVNGRPTYKLLPGTVGESFALAVAERLELPKSVLDRANELLDSETRQMGELIRELEDQKALLDQQSADMEEKLKEIKRMEFAMKEEQLRVEKKQLTVRRDEARKFAKKLEEKEQILEEILEKLKSDPSRKLVARSWNDIKYVKRDAIKDAENIPSLLARKQIAAAAQDMEAQELVPFAELRDKPDLQEGDTVVVCKKGPLFAREATVLKTMGNNRIEVQVNNMNVAFKLTEIAMPVANGPKPQQSSASGKPNRSKSISKAAERLLAHENDGATSEWERARQQQQPGASEGKQATMRTESNTVNVLGCNLLEAQEKIKDKFSASLMSGRTTVYILHGHGTGGVLKSKIRNWLKTERTLVKRWQPADKEDGGDALTRVELK